MSINKRYDDINKDRQQLLYIEDKLSKFSVHQPRVIMKPSCAQFYSRVDFILVDCAFAASFNTRALVESMILNRMCDDC